MTPTALTNAPGSAAPFPSPGETVIRHASAFQRAWPEPVGPVPPHPAPELTARVDLADLELAGRLLADAPGPVLTAARSAARARWTWAVTYACGRDLGRPEVVSESLALRVSRPRHLPWRLDRGVGVWRRTGGAGSWSFLVGWRWSTDGPQVTASPTRLAASELSWWLKTGGEHTANPKPGKNSRTRVQTDTR